MIDGKKAAITLDSEQTLGDVLAGLDEYLERAGFCVCALELDGETVREDALSGALPRSIHSVQSLNVATKTNAEMALVALRDALAFVSAAEEEPAAGEKAFTRFLEHPSMSYLKNNERALYDALCAAFPAAAAAEGGAPSAAAAAPLRALREKLAAVIEERERELSAPLAGLKAMAGDVQAVCARLGDFSLDAQTGKDVRAAETVEICAALMQKFFRLMMLSRFYGMNPESVFDSGAMEEFNGVLKEFLAAYEQNDIVLSGDLAEYEIAPRFQALYNDIFHFIKEHI